MFIDFLPRLLIGGAVAGVAARHAARRGLLTPGGEYAAFAVGLAAVLGGVGWLLSLAVFFYSSVVLTRWHADEKRRRSLGMLPELRSRDAWQVLANGGVFAVGALAWAFTGNWEAGLLGFGALAAATADTWATEVGMALQGTPRSIVNGEPVEPGTSGGVSAQGLAAAVAGAFVIGLCAVASFTVPFDIPRLEAVFLGGLIGTVTDSLLGATVQSRRWCDACQAWTERRVHTCGYRSHHRRGYRWMTNDTVNLVSAVVGGIVAMGAWIP